MNFWRFFFIIFRYIFCHSDLDPWPKVTNFNRVRASAISNYLAKSSSKLVHSFEWNFVHKKRAGHTDRQTDTHTHTDTQTHRYTDKLQWKYNPSTISWMCKNVDKLSNMIAKHIVLIFQKSLKLYWYLLLSYRDKLKG